MQVSVFIYFLPYIVHVNYTALKLSLNVSSFHWWISSQPFVFLHLWAYIESSRTLSKLCRYQKQYFLPYPVLIKDLFITKHLVTKLVKFYWYLAALRTRALRELVTPSMSTFVTSPALDNDRVDKTTFMFIIAKKFFRVKQYPVKAVSRSTVMIGPRRNS